MVGQELPVVGVFLGGLFAKGSARSQALRDLRSGLLPVSITMTPVTADGSCVFCV